MVELRGTRELVGRLRRNANLGDVKDVVRLNTSEMHRKAQRNAPVRTGNLKRNIKQNISDGGFVGRVSSEAEYAINGMSPLLVTAG